MSTTYRQAISLGNERARRTLRAVMRHRGMTNRSLSKATEIPENTVQRYTGGDAQLTAGHLELFGEALRVPSYVLSMETNAAIRWIIDHAPNTEGEDQNWKKLTTNRSPRTVRGQWSDLAA